MTTHEVMVWYVWPTLVAVLAGGGGLWLSTKL